MTTINLKDFYYWYLTDELVEVPDEVAEELMASKRREAAHAERVRYNKAYYSLDCDDGIEYSACLHEPSPQELMDRKELFFRLWNALNSLPEIQVPAVERPQLPAGDPGPPGGRSFDPGKELPPDRPRGGRGQEHHPSLGGTRERADEKIFAGKFLIYSLHLPFFSGGM